MSVTINLSSEELAQIKRFTELDNDIEAVAKAIREFLRVAQLRELKDASRKLDYQDVSDAMEAMELRERHLKPETNDLVQETANPQIDQSSTFRPRILPKSMRLRVRSVASFASAIAAIFKSMLPTRICPCFKFSNRVAASVPKSTTGMLQYFRNNILSSR
jgi:hypothetical protein